MEKPKTKNKRISSTILSIILVIVGLGCLLARPIRNVIVQHHTEQALSTKMVKHDPHPSYNASLKGVQNIPPKNTVPPIATIFIPSVGIKLPVFEGLNDAKMDTGVCTVVPNRQFNQNGNVVIAGHHLQDQKLLFGRLTNVKPNDNVYITNSQHQTFKYKITQTKVVYETDMAIENNTPNQKQLTLFTCASGNPGTPYRFVATAQQTN